MCAWRLNEAKESCGTVFDRAWGGEPQIIMRDEKPMVVVVSFAAYEAAKPKKGTLFEALRSCPLGGVELNVERDKLDCGRHVELA